MTRLAMLERLQAWRNAGWLAALDLAFARFVHELDEDAPASLLLAAALLAQLEGRGHSCLPLAEIAQDANALLGWPAAAAQELGAALSSWPGDGTAARAAWGDSELMQMAPADDCGSSPLVLCGGRLYLRRYWRYESQVAGRIRLRTQVQAVPREAADANLGRADPAQARALLAQLFAQPASAAAGLAAEPDWQQIACALALRGRLTLITGGPGTGKTYTAARLLVLLQALHGGPQPLRIALAAPTGKAAARLRQSIDVALQGLHEQLGAALPRREWAAQLGPARTLHSLLGTRPGTRRFVHDAAHPLDLDLLIVDEASMVHLEMMAALLDALPATARLVLLGDKDQLASVEAGAVMAELCQAPPGGAGAYRPDTAQWLHEFSAQALPAAEIGPGSDLAQQTVVLRHSRRFAGAIGQVALAVNAGDAMAALALLGTPNAGELALLDGVDAGAVAPLAVNGRAAAPGGYRACLELLASRPADALAFDAWARTVLTRFDALRVLCAVREGPWGVSALNAAIERALADAGLLPGRGEWYEGRPVMVTRNDASLGVFNGDIGVVLRAPAGMGLGPVSLRAYFLDGAALRSVAVGRLAEVETAFAMTVHKSQGSEFDHVVLVLPEDDSPVLTRELVYTGITRARQALTLVSRHHGQLVSALGRRTLRVSGLADMLG